MGDHELEMVRHKLQSWSEGGGGAGTRITFTCMKGFAQEPTKPLQFALRFSMDLDGCMYTRINCDGFIKTPFVSPNIPQISPK